jgi:hypothetical protein
MFFEQSNYRDDAFLFASVNTQNRSDRPTKRQIGPRTQRPNSQFKYALKRIFSVTEKCLGVHISSCPTDRATEPRRFDGWQKTPFVASAT